MVRITRTRVSRRLVNAIGRVHASTMRMEGPPLAGWARFRRPNGSFLWLRCRGRVGVRYTEPKVFRQADAALSPDERRQLLEEFNRTT